jgi:hypothetical protein
MSLLRHGHAPGHVRDMFLEAVEAYNAWEAGEPEPTVEYEIGYVPRPIPISRACGLLWNCTDILPGTAFDGLEWCGVSPKPRTYAAAARAMKREIEERKAS